MLAKSNGTLSIEWSPLQRVYFRQWVLDYSQDFQYQLLVLVIPTKAKGFSQHSQVLELHRESVREALGSGAFHPGPDGRQSSPGKHHETDHRHV